MFNLAGVFPPVHAGLITANYTKPSQSWSAQAEVESEGVIMQLIIASVWIVLGSVVLFKVDQQLSEVSSLHSGQNVSREYRYASPIPFNFQR